MLACMYAYVEAILSSTLMFYVYQTKYVHNNEALLANGLICPLPLQFVTMLYFIDLGGFVCDCLSRVLSQIRLVQYIWQKSYFFHDWRHQSKVTGCLQGHLTRKQCNAFWLNCRYLKPHIKLKLFKLAFLTNSYIYLKKCSVDILRIF